MKHYKKIALWILLSGISLNLNHAYCNEHDGQIKKENIEESQKINSIKKSFNQLFNNVSEMKKNVINNYNKYKNENKENVKKDLTPDAGQHFIDKIIFKNNS